MNTYYIKRIPRKLVDELETPEGRKNRDLAKNIERLSGKYIEGIRAAADYVGEWPRMKDGKGWGINENFEYFIVKSN